MCPLLSALRPHLVQTQNRVLQVPRILAQSLWVHMYNDTVYLEGFVILVSSIPSGSNNHSIYSSRVPWALRGRIWWRIPFRDGCSKVSHTLYIVWLWVSVFVHIFHRRKLFWRRLTKALIYEYSRISLGVISLLHFFYRTVVFGITLGP